MVTQSLGADSTCIGLYYSIHKDSGGRDGSHPQVKKTRDSGEKIVIGSHFIQEIIAILPLPLPLPFFLTMVGLVANPSMQIAGNGNGNWQELDEEDGSLAFYSLSLSLLTILPFGSLLLVHIYMVWIRRI